MIKLLVLDVDGTMTDGGIYYDATGNEVKKFAVRDGAGILLARAAGIEVLICTGRACEALAHRARDLKIKYLYQDVQDKAAFLKQFLAEHNLQKEEVAYCGDDLNDLAAMALCGFAACPADAVQAVRAHVDYICPQKGGQGAVRGVVDQLLRREGRWQQAARSAFGADV